MRLRARIDIREPLKKEKKVKRPRGEWLLAKFRYERLPNFCFICGRIGHIDHHCEIYFRLPDDKIIRHWDITLRAPPLQSSLLGGEKWLVEEEPVNKDDRVAMTVLDTNKGGMSRLHNAGLLANLGASRSSQKLPLKEIYEVPAAEKTPLILADDRKRPRTSGKSNSGAVSMEVEPSVQKEAGFIARGIQVPSSLALAGPHGVGSCPGQ
ncbi:hypothetical protein LINPERHAP1_LOCUS21143 [Linum perenne]